MKWFSLILSILLSLPCITGRAQSGVFALSDTRVNMNDQCQVPYTIIYDDWLIQANKDLADSIICFMNRNPQVQIEIQYHTDMRGSADYNDTLSQKRAESFRNEILRSSNIDQRRIIATGCGERFPAVVTEDLHNQYPFLMTGMTLDESYIYTIHDKLKAEKAHACNRRMILRIVTTNFPAEPLHLKAMSFNIRYNNPADGDNSWDQRKEDVVRLFRYEQPDIFGIQEGLNDQVLYLKTNLPEYDYIGVGREDGKKKGEYAAIFYNKIKFRVVRQNTFWLSDRPDTVSVGWDAALERICTYGIFEHLESGKRFLFLNTHFDHMGALAREKSAALILEKIKSINYDTLPVILCGDFNTSAGSQPILLLQSQLSEASAISQTPLYGPAGTYNAFNPTNNVTECIDYFFVQRVKVRSVTHIDDKRPNDRVLSDHYPVLIEIDF